MTTAGNLRETVTLQNPPAVDDGGGGQVGGWTTVTDLRAEVAPLSGNEATIAGAETGIARYRVTIRLRDVATGQRLLWRGLAFDIRAVLPRTDRAFLDLTCDAARA
ncbi:MAG: phage head closure protein [Janthinobacterium lividum]